MAQLETLGSAVTRVEKTTAERRFEEVQKKRLAEKAKKQALKTHKDRVADFNDRLEAQSEHFDIPKVSNNFLLLLTSDRDLLDVTRDSGYSISPIQILGLYAKRDYPIIRFVLLTLGCALFTQVGPG